MSRSGDTHDAEDAETRSRRGPPAAIYWSAVTVAIGFWIIFLGTKLPREHELAVNTLFVLGGGLIVAGWIGIIATLVRGSHR